MNKLGRLSEVEMEVMQTIWAMTEPVTVARLQEMFEQKKGWKTSTVATMLEQKVLCRDHFASADQKRRKKKQCPFARNKLMLFKKRT